MDKFVLDEAAIKRMNNRNALVISRRIVEFHSRRQYCSVRGIIYAPNRGRIAYSVEGGEDWAKSKEGFFDPPTSEWGLFLEGNLHIGTRETPFQPPHPDYKDAMYSFCFDLEGGGMRFDAWNGTGAEYIAKKLGKNFSSEEKERMDRFMAMDFFLTFDYVQREAMKERHRIEKFRNRTMEETKNTQSKQREPSPIWIRDGIQYTYTYEDEPKTHREILCELWSVRGHYRHYKSGKVSYIAPYQKGKRRNEGAAPGHTYILEEETKSNEMD